MKILIILLVFVQKQKELEESIAALEKQGSDSGANAVKHNAFTVCIFRCFHRQMWTSLSSMCMNRGQIRLDMCPKITKRYQKFDKSLNFLYNVNR